MLLEAETNKYCPGGNDFGAISNLITWVLDFFLSVARISVVPCVCRCLDPPPPPPPDHIEPYLGVQKPGLKSDIFRDGPLAHREKEI
jgi:hypothetical protein